MKVLKLSVVAALLALTAVAAGPFEAEATAAAPQRVAAVRAATGGARPAPISARRSTAYITTHVN